jgi:MYXO-CTERM domain-containing protein
VVRLAPLGASLASAETVRFRFVAEEVGASAFPVVEAVLDDVGVFSAAPSCAGTGPGVEPDARYVAPPKDDGGCSMGRGAGGGGLGVALVALGMILVARRRRR